jgi:hypothetical protein
VTTLEEATESIGRRFATVPGLACSRSQTDEPYVEILTVSKPTMAAAVADWLEKVEVYLAGRAGTIYWRVKPALSKSENGWRIYARLLISDRPVVFPSLDEAMTVLNKRRGSGA